ASRRAERFQLAAQGSQWLWREVFHIGHAHFGQTARVALEKRYLLELARKGILRIRERVRTAQACNRFRGGVNAGQVGCGLLQRSEVNSFGTPSEQGGRLIK